MVLLPTCQNHQQTQRYYIVQSTSVRLCPFLSDCALFFVRFYPFLFDFFNFCPMGLATQNENHIDRGVTSRSYFTSRSSWCIRTRFYTATVTDTNLIAPKTISIISEWNSSCTSIDKAPLNCKWYALHFWIRAVEKYIGWMEFRMLRW